ncbi:hypothetical protein Pve01_35950 [Planomonospora venezuelensis]|uniref:Uncharacterized protein n=1 Tax=Planomonospora venezuelensis TaxID=1999 RepID=A0A841CU18_PLAVE|nr:hypothetical protein [Planomonospora venezuelensis]GIN01937.1 hypothetical protein Pve01_35950 [Planomonospora venezuelensis]
MRPPVPRRESKHFFGVHNASRTGVLIHEGAGLSYPHIIPARVLTAIDIRPRRVPGYGFLVAERGIDPPNLVLLLSPHQLGFRKGARWL